ncbi:MAG: GIY-YIG nuclease family protein [Gemmatimonadota bacterium]|jgi:hypothetical protein
MDRKEMKRQYKETPRPAGVYRIRNTRSGRALVGTSVDAPAMLNRQRLQLRTGGHPNRALQQDWNADGADAFTFEVLDTLTPRDEPGFDLDQELRLLEQLWLEKLDLSDDDRY